MWAAFEAYFCFLLRILARTGSVKAPVLPKPVGASNITACFPFCIASKMMGMPTFWIFAGKRWSVPPGERVVSISMSGPCSGSVNSSSHVVPRSVSGSRSMPPAGKSGPQALYLLRVLCHLLRSTPISARRSAVMLSSAAASAAMAG